MDFMRDNEATKFNNHFEAKVSYYFIQIRFTHIYNAYFRDYFKTK